MKRFKVIKKIIVLVILFFVLSIFSNLVVQAQGIGNSNNINNLNNISLKGSGINIQELDIPFFTSFIDFNTNNASIWTWLIFAGGLFTVGLVIFWISLLVRAGFKAMQSGGNAEGLTELSKSIRSIFIGITLTIMVPIILSVTGTALGIGNVFQWPKMFTKCNVTSGTVKYEYYFQAYLAAGSKHIDPKTYADSQCQAN